MAESKELQIQEKQKAASLAEHTKPGLVFTPAIDILESDRELMLLADMPGVAAEDVMIDLRNGVLTLSGDVKPYGSADETDVLTEFDIGKYHRQFTLSETIDQDKIEAKSVDGVLHLILPKAEKAMPRTIAVSAG